MEEEKKPACCCEEENVEGIRHKERSAEEFKDLMNRLKRVEGQVRGIEGMLERTCTARIFWFRFLQCSQL